MSDERPKSDSKPKGFRLKSLSNEAEEADYEEAPTLADAPPSRRAPISEAHVMSEAEVSEVKAGRERQVRRAQTRISMKSFLKILALLIVIVAVIVGLAALHDSGATTGSTTPTTPAPEGKAPAPAEKGKKAKQKSGHHKAGAKHPQKNKKDLPRVKLIPPVKDDASSGDSGPSSSDDSTSPSPTINGMEDEEIGHSDKVIAEAKRILEAKKYPANYRNHPTLLKKYMEQQLDYPVALTTVSDRHGVLGMSIILPLGKVLLTHLQGDALAPQITWVKLWKPDLTP